MDGKRWEYIKFRKGIIDRLGILPGMSGIYTIEFLDINSVYIGASSDILSRVKSHLRDMYQRSWRSPVKQLTNNASENIKIHIYKLCWIYELSAEEMIAINEYKSLSL